MKILYFIYGLSVGGAETFLQNVLEKIDFDQHKIEFVIQTFIVRNEKIKNIIDENSIKVHYITSYYKNPIKSTLELKKVLMNGEFDIIHIHVNALLNITPIILAEKYNVKIILHSHNSANAGGGEIGKVLHCFNRQLISKYNTVNLACSSKAGRWMFKDSDYEIVYNGIDIDKYQFNSKVRNDIRYKYGIKDSEYLIGHVGRFVEAKNHEFFVKCINEMIGKGIPVKAILVGDGPLRKKIVSIVKKDGLENNIIFVGQVINASDYYSAFDVMLFPSTYEGLPFTMVEAQVSGLPVIASDVITKQVNVTGLVTYLNLKLSIKEWSMAIIDNLQNKRIVHDHEMKKSVFNIDNTVMRMEEIYGKVNNRE